METASFSGSFGVNYIHLLFVVEIFEVFLDIIEVVRSIVLHR
jgi:hypothetical protein